jgi:curved DNA-binding protein CbpA
VTHYEVLGVAPSAPIATVRQAYVEQARVHHPDRGGDPDAMRAVNAAWATLSDPGRRALYDLTLAEPVSRPSAPEPDPARWRTDDEELLADLDDDRPLGGVVRLPRWISLLPVGCFALSVLLGFFGVIFVSSEMIGASIAAFLTSCVLFLVSPFIALAASRRTTR